MTDTEGTETSAIDPGGTAEHASTEEAASARCHDLLAALAGRAPDDLVATARQWLDQDRHADVARAAAFAVLNYRIALTDKTLRALAGLLAVNDLDLTALGQAEVAVSESMPPFVFTPNRTESAGTSDAAPGNAAPDDAVGAAAQGAAVRGVWRAWRHTADASPWPPPRPVYLVEVERIEDRHHVAAAVARAVDEATGEPGAQVEAYATGHDVGFYQGSVRAAGELVWAASAERTVEVAQLFDRLDDEGEPAFAPDRARIEADDERERLARYLDAGAPLLVTTARGDDVLDPDRGAVVPMSFRTDGTWIWSEAVTYYLREHGIRPQDAFVEHLDEVADSPPSVDGVDLHRAAAALSM